MAVKYKTFQAAKKRDKKKCYNEMRQHFEDSEVPWLEDDQSILSRVIDLDIIKTTHRSTVSAVSVKGVQDRGFVLKTSDGPNQGYHTAKEVVGLMTTQCTNAIVSVYLYGYDGIYLWILLEILATTLDKLLEWILAEKKNGRMRFDEIVSVSKVVLRKLFAGINKMHDRLVCHQDLKGDNVLVEITGELKLTDMDMVSLLTAANQLINEDVGNDFYKQVKTNPLDSAMPPRYMPAKDYPNAAGMVAELLLPSFKDGYFGDAALAHMIFGGRFDDPEDIAIKKFFKYIMSCRCLKNTEMYDTANRKYDQWVTPSNNDLTLYADTVAKFFMKTSSTDLCVYLSMKNLTFFWPQLRALKIRDSLLISWLNKTIAVDETRRDYIKIDVVLQAYWKAEAKLKAHGKATANKTKIEPTNTSKANITQATGHESRKLVEKLADKTKFGKKDLPLPSVEDPVFYEAEESAESDEEEQEIVAPSFGEASKTIFRKLLDECLIMMKEKFELAETYSYFGVCKVCHRQIYIGSDYRARSKSVEANAELAAKQLDELVYVASGDEPTYCNNTCFKKRAKKNIDEGAQNVPATPKFNALVYNTIAPKTAGKEAPKQLDFVPESMVTPTKDVRGRRGTM